MNRRTRFPLLVGCALLLSPIVARAQDLSSEVVVSFPPETVRIEFLRPAKLRELPAYASLRKRYVGPRLSELEGSLSRLGIQERDIDQIVLGWQPLKKEAGPDGDATPPSDPQAIPGQGMNRSMWPDLLDGLALGRFDLDAIARRASAEGIRATSLGGLKAYCLQAESVTCVVFLNESLGAFGTRETLTGILAARDGRGANLVSSPRLLRLLHDVPKQASIWGVAVGPAVAEWFKGWLPGQGDLKIDWSHTFEAVEALSYSVEADERIRLYVNLTCTTPEAAAKLTQLFQGLKLIQHFAWQHENPNRFNPLEALEVENNGSQVSLKLITAFMEIQDYASFPLPLSEK